MSCNCYSNSVSKSGNKQHCGTWGGGGDARGLRLQPWSVGLGLVEAYSLISAWTSAKLTAALPPAPSPSCSRGPPPPLPAGSPGRASYRWRAASDYTGCHSTSPPGEDGTEQVRQRVDHSKCSSQRSKDGIFSVASLGKSHRPCASFLRCSTLHLHCGSPLPFICPCYRV